ncbi:MAG: hypothetical protein IJ443_01450 [Firmicutes bacterium]|nr:hypothetical protein [Bacillota bacterium]
MIRSRFLWITVAVILALTVVIFFLISGSLGQISEEVLKPSYSEIKAKADILMEFDASIRDVKIVNSEEGYFAVEPHENKVEIVDLTGQSILKTNFIQMGEKAGNYIPGYDGISWWLLDCTSLEMKQVSILNAVLHQSGEYMVGNVIDEVNGWAIEDSATGEILLESDCPLILTQQKGYVIKLGSEDGGQRDQIINLKTGEAEYTADQWEMVKDGNAGFWEIWYEEVYEYQGRPGTRFCKYILDENYELAFDGQLFSEIYLTDAVICGEMRNAATLEAFREKSDPSDFVFIMNYDGQMLYKMQPESKCMMIDAFGNYAVMRDNNNKNWLLEVQENGGVIRHRMDSKFPAMDDEDRFMAVAESDHYIPELTPDRWSYMNVLTMEPMFPFEFTSASKSENGYAVAKHSSGSILVLDLYQRNDKG